MKPISTKPMMKRMKELGRLEKAVIDGAINYVQNEDKEHHPKNYCALEDSVAALIKYRGGK